MEKKNRYIMLLIRENNGFFSAGYSWLLVSKDEKDFETALRKAKEEHPDYDYKAHHTCEHS